MNEIMIYCSIYTCKTLNLLTEYDWLSLNQSLIWSLICNFTDAVTQTNVQNNKLLMQFEKFQYLDCMAHLSK